MKVLLANPTRERLFEQPSLGLLYIAGALKKAGHRVEYVEGDAIDLELAICRQLAFDSTAPDVVAFTVMSPMFNEVKEVVRRIQHFCWEGSGREQPVLVAGGAHATLMPETLLEIGFDSVIQGEGERAIVDLLDHKIMNGIKTLHYNPIDDLDSLAFPARELLPEKYIKRHAASIMASRGCPYNCSFCQPTLRTIFGKYVRRRSPDNVVLEMKEAWSQGFRYFEFFDDTFTSDREWLMNFCELLEVQGLPWRWECLTRVNAVDEEILSALKTGGCHRITFGVESGSQEILDFYQKGITVEQTRRAFRLCREHGIHTHALFMLGAPIETRATIWQTEQLIREIQPDSIFVSITTPLPFTQLWDDCQHKQEIQLDWSEMNYYHKPALKLQYLSPADIVEARERILKKFYLSHPGFVVKLLRARGWSYFGTVVRNLFGGS